MLNLKSNLPNGSSCCVKLCLLSFDKNPHQTSDIVIISAAKHHHLHKSLKIKFKARQEFAKDKQGCCLKSKNMPRTKG